MAREARVRATRPADRTSPVSEEARVDFYVLSAADASAAARFACRLAEKAWRLGHSVHLRTESAAAAAALDDLLWTYRQGSFVPHELVRPGQQAGSPVTISTDEEPAADVLINLAPTAPGRPEAFGRVAEIVDGSDDGKARGRDRFNAYRERGMEPSTHRIGEEP